MGSAASTAPVIDARLVERLVASQFPRWGGLAVRAVTPGGWDNRTFRLGEDMLVRLPSAEGYAGQVEKEQRWLPLLGGRLPVAIPEPLAMGEPGCGYPWRWSVYRWIEGETAAAVLGGAGGGLAAGSVDRAADVAADPAADLAVGLAVDLAVDLAAFLAALHRVDASGGPAAGPHNFHRGGSLAHYDAEARRAIGRLGRDQAGAMRVWEAALGSAWTARPVWVHGDVAGSNLIVRDGHLSAVIDFGNLGVGDPACDLVIAWTLFDGAAREAFREAVGLDAATWARARGWALWKAAITVVGGGAGAEGACGVIGAVVGEGGRGLS